MTGLPNCIEPVGSKELANFKELVIQAMDQRTSIQLQNVQARNELTAALAAAHEERAPWKAYSPDEEAVGNVTKRLNVSCEDAFRVHLVIHDGGRVLFPKVEAAEAFVANGTAEALHEIARRYALHRMPIEAVVARRGMQAR